MKTILLTFGLALLLFACKATPPAPAARFERQAKTRADSLELGQVYFEAANLQYGIGALDSARTLFVRALGFDSLNPRFYHGLGSTLGRLKQHDEAQAAFHEALRLKPDYVSAWWHKGCDNAVAGKTVDALKDLAEAIALDARVKAWPAEDSCWFHLLDDPRLVALTEPDANDPTP